VLMEVTLPYPVVWSNHSLVDRVYSNPW